MTVHSGMFGAVNGLSTIRNWSISETWANTMYIASNTGAGSARVTGVNAWSGSMGYYGAIPPVMPGQFFTFLGYTAPDDDALGSNGNTCSGSAIIDSVAITFDFASAAIISQTLNFSGHLGLTWGVNQSAILDETDVDAVSMCGLKVDYSSNGSDFSTLSDVTTATLTITAKNGSYTNSSTGCTTGRIRGPIDWTAAINRQCDTKQLVGAANYVWRFYTAASEYYEMKWGKIKDFTNLNVNIESGNEPVSHTVNLEMNGMNPSRGHIILPDTTEFWPALS